MSPYDFPPEYGVEEGERCGRGYGCTGRMIFDDEVHHVCMPGEPCFCDTDGVIVCGVCGEGPDG